MLSMTSATSQCVHLTSYSHFAQYPKAKSILSMEIANHLPLESLTYPNRANTSVEYTTLALQFSIFPSLNGSSFFHIQGQVQFIHFDEKSKVIPE